MSFGYSGFGGGKGSSNTENDGTPTPLSSVLNSESTSTAATSKAVKTLNDKLISDKTELLIGISDVSSQLTENEIKTARYTMANTSTYGATGDGVKRTIAEVFPHATISNIQALNPVATINNSADWYALQLCINKNETTFIPNTGKDYIIDLPINIPENHVVYGELTGYPNGSTTSIKNVGIGTDALIMDEQTEIQKIMVSGRTGSSTNRSGNGLLIKGSYCKIKDCTFNANGGYGIRFFDKHIVTCWITDCMVNYNQKGGIYGESREESSMICIYINGGYIGQNGSNEDGSVPTVPLSDWGDGIRFDGGINLNINRTVCEYNHGAGIHISSLNHSGFTHTLLGGNINGNHLEGNFNGEFRLSNTQGNILRLNVLGNHYFANNSQAFNIDRPGSISSNCNIENTYGANSLTNSMRYSNGLFYGGMRLDKEELSPVVPNTQLVKNKMNSYIFIDHNVKYVDGSTHNAIFQNNRQRYLLKFQFKLVSKSLTQAFVFLYPRKYDGNPSDTTNVTTCTGVSGGDSGWKTVTKSINAGTFSDETDYLQISMHWNGNPVEGDMFMVRDIEFIPYNDPIIPSYTSENRPTAATGLALGTTIVDSTLGNVPLFWNGANWINMFTGEIT